MSSKLSRWKKIRVSPIYWLVLFLMFGNRSDYFIHAIKTLDVLLLGKVLLSMCSPLAIAIANPTYSEWRKALRYARYSKAYPYNK